MTECKDKEKEENIIYRALVCLQERLETRLDRAKKNGWDQTEQKTKEDLDITNRLISKILTDEILKTKE
jgi:hypothetical protein